MPLKEFTIEVRFMCAKNLLRLNQNQYQTNAVILQTGLGT